MRAQNMNLGNCTTVMKIIEVPRNVTQYDPYTIIFKHENCKNC
jgi:hypothetical protein